ncbi:MAG: T9SS type A sorting domain-containing protein [Sphingobacteriales bacterium]|nr:MAG: T9SS type A sorting domain-containing protein [Sphingobacteriales bacterium]
MKAQSFNVTVDNVTLNCTSAPPQLTLTLYANSDVEYLVDNWNLFLYFNSLALSNLQVTIAPGFSGNYGNGVQVLDGITQFNAFWNGAANSQTESFSNLPNELATLTFDVLDGNLPSGLLFEATQTFGSDNNFQEFYTSNPDIFGGISLLCAVPVCQITDLQTGVQGICNPNTNTYTQEIVVTYQDSPASGQLSVNGQVFDITASPQTVTLTGLNADGALVSVNAFFTDDNACSLSSSDLFTAPANCIVVPVCAITSITAGAQSTCDPITNTYSQEITVTYENAPLGGSLMINGQSFAITGSPQTETLNGLVADGGNVTVMAAFTDDTACNSVVNDLFTAPANCEVIPFCAITSLTAGAQSTCDPITNTYSQEITVTYENAPLGGNLMINGQSFAITGSPQTETLNGLVADGGNVTVMAAFTDDTACNSVVNDLFTAPANCEVVLNCAITDITAGTQSICDPLTNTYTQEITVSYTDAPNTGDLVVNGQSFAVTGSPQTVTLNGLTADGLMVSVTASFSDDAGCNFAVDDLFTAPANCEVVLNCAITDITAGTQSACDPLTNTYTQEITITYEDAPASGDLMVNGQAYAIATSPQTVILTNLIADGATFSVSVFFSDNVGCAIVADDFITAPESCALPDPCEGVVIEVASAYTCLTGLFVSSSGGVEPYSFTANGTPVENDDILTNGTYTIVATDANGCSNAVDNVLTVNNLTTLLVDYNCESGILLNTVDGVAPFSFSLNGDPISDGELLDDGTYLIEASDDNGCNASLVLVVSCACAPDAGNMSTLLQTVCDGNLASALSEGLIVDTDSGEFGVYLVHTTADVNDGGIIGVFATPSDPAESITFAASDLNGAVNNTLYYITTVVGRTDEDSDGIPDLGDACTDISESQPVVFLDPLIVDIQPICDPFTFEYTLTISASGGYPAFDNGALYTVFGDMDDQFSSTIQSAPYPSDAAYLIGVSDGGGCAYSESRIIDCNPTPVSMLRFDGIVLPQGNLLSWTTATETNNDYFTLTRSADGINFTTVGIVKGAGTVSTSRSYELLDKNAPSGISYYRLVQTDFDGTTSLASGIIVLQRNVANLGFVEVSPIPAFNLLNITFNTGLSGEVEFAIYDLTGRKIEALSKIAQQGVNNLSIDVKNYASGIYFLSMNNGLDVQTIRFVKE